MANVQRAMTFGATGDDVDNDGVNHDNRQYPPPYTQ